MEQVGSTARYPNTQRSVRLQSQQEPSAERPGDNNDDNDSTADDELDRRALTVKLQETLVERDTMIKDLQRQLTRVSAERNTLAAKLARFSVHGNPNSSPRPAPSSSKSPKLRDPPILTNGKNPEFDDWLLSMQVKLKTNADHFSTKELRLNYIFMRTGGKARKHMTTRMRADAFIPYHDADDVFKHLETIYGDPNRDRKAQIAFQNLSQGSDKFMDFLSEFLYLAAEARVAQEVWKQELFLKLNFKMQNITLSEFGRDESFEEYTKFCKLVAFELVDINGSSTAPAPSAARLPRASTPRADIDKATVKLRTRNKLCYECGKPGHFARDCFQRKS